MEFSELVIGV